MIKISETNYDYIFDNGQFSLIISKNTWKQLPQSKPGDMLRDGDATVIFSKTSNGIKIQKTFRGKQLVLNLDEKTWEYIKKWIRCPEKRDELTAKYKDYMKPEAVKQRSIERFKAQFENPEYIKQYQQQQAIIEAARKERERLQRLADEKKQKEREECYAKMHEAILSGEIELPF